MPSGAASCIASAYGARSYGPMVSRETVASARDS